MALDIERFRRRREESKQGRGGGQSFYKFPEGRTVFYLCPPTADMSGVPFLEVNQHGQVGAGKKMHVCLDETNAILGDPVLAKLLAEKKLAVGDCPTCGVVSGADPAPTGMSGEAVDAMDIRTNYPMLIIPWGQIRSGEFASYPEAERVPRILLAGYKLWDGVCAVIELEGDITAQDGAVLLVCLRKGTGLSTQYDVSAYSETIRSPLRLPKSQQAALRKAQESGGDGDLYRVVANLTKSADDVRKMLRGEATETREAVDPGRPHCYALDTDSDDPECQACPWKEPCAKERGVEVPPDPGASRRRGEVGSARDPRDAEPKSEPKSEPKAEPKAEPKSPITEFLDGKLAAVKRRIEACDDADLLAKVLFAERKGEKRGPVLKAIYERSGALAEAEASGDDGDGDDVSDDDADDLAPEEADDGSSEDDLDAFERELAAARGGRKK